MKKSITLNGITFIGEYSPEEPMVRYYNSGDGYPGCHSQFDIKGILGTAEDFINLVYKKVYEPMDSISLGAFTYSGLMEKLEQLCLENMEE